MSIIVNLPAEPEKTIAAEPAKAGMTLSDYVAGRLAQERKRVASPFPPTSLFPDDTKPHARKKKPTKTLEPIPDNDYKNQLA